MSLYEGMFLMDNRQANRDWDASLAMLTSFITKHGGEIVRATKWGERRLAYDIEGRRRGTYVLAYFNAQGDAPNRIYRECELSDLIQRAIILKVDRLPSEEETPPGDVEREVVQRAMRSGGDDRRRGGPRFRGGDRRSERREEEPPVEEAGEEAEEKA